MTDTTEEKAEDKPKRKPKKVFTPLHEKILSVAKKSEYMQRKDMKQMGMGLKFDDLMGAIRINLIEEGILVYARQTSFSKVKDYSGSSQSLYEGSYDVHFVNVDSPRDKIVIPIISHGMDGGDKAPGKAHTYAMKVAIKTMFMVETGIDDESYQDRMIAAELEKNITKEQEFELAGLIQGNQALMAKILGAYNISMLNQLYAVQFEEVKQRIIKALELVKEKAAQSDNS